MGGTKKRKLRRKIPAVAETGRKNQPARAPAVAARTAVELKVMMPSPAGRFMRIETVMAETGLPRSTIYYFVKNGRFPKPAQLSKRISAWEAAAVRAWVQARIEESANLRTEAA